VAERPPITAGRDGPRSPELRALIAEFGRHLDILADQLGASVLEADRECVSVGESFHELAAARSIIDGMDCPEPQRSALRKTGRQMGESLHAAVVALQYHDRLAQRLGLVRAGLDRLQLLLKDDRSRSYDEWIRSLHEVERINRSERLRLGPEPDDGPGVAQSAGEPASDVELF
jgi:hypothetical protein